MKLLVGFWEEVIFELGLLKRESEDRAGRWG